MTGQQLITRCLRQCNTSQRALEQSADSYTEWALETVNIAAEQFFYEIQSRVHDTLSRQIVYKNFRGGETDVSADYDYLFIDDQVKVVAVFAKFTEDGRRVPVTHRTVKSLGGSLDTLYDFQAITRAIYVIVGRRLLVVPRPLETVPNGLEIHLLLPFSQLTDMNHNIASIPHDYHRVLIPKVKADIYDRLQRQNEANRELALFDIEMSKAIKKMIGRGGNRARARVAIPKYI